MAHHSCLRVARAAILVTSSLWPFTTAGAAPSEAPPSEESSATTSDESLADREEELKTYLLGDTMEVRGRFDRLTGIAATSSEGRIGYVDFAARPLLREAELIETVPGFGYRL